MQNLFLFLTHNLIYFSNNNDSYKVKSKKYENGSEDCA